MTLLSRLIVAHRISLQDNRSHVGDYHLCLMLILWATIGATGWGARSLIERTPHALDWVTAATLMLTPIAILMIRLSWNRNGLAHVKRVILFHGEWRDWHTQCANENGLLSGIHRQLGKKHDEKLNRVILLRNELKAAVDEREAKFKNYLKLAKSIDS